MYITHLRTYRILCLLKFGFLAEKRIFDTNLCFNQNFDLEETISIFGTISGDCYN